MTIATNPHSALPAEFRARFTGRIVSSADGDYDELRRVTFAGADRHPGLILRPRTTADVVAAVNYARDRGRELAVRSGGHSGAGHSSTEGGIVIDVRDMKALNLEVGSKTVWAATGLTAGEVSKATLAEGLIVGFGDTGSVGVGGIVTGGGIGYLVRKFGLSIDNVLAAELVTADGAVHMVDATHEPDLFWAIRGGGGNFGVVTGLRFQLHDLPAFTGGMMVIPATAETIAGFVAAARAAPDGLSTIGNVMPAPPMPFLKPEDHGKLIIMAMLAYAGPADEAEKVLQPFRALATPLADFVKPGSYMSMFPPEDPNYRPVAVSRNIFMENVDRAMGQNIVDRLAKSDAPMRVVQLRVLGGASARVFDNATAYGHRTRSMMANVAAFHSGTPEDEAEKSAWLEEFCTTLRDGGDTAAYVNFIGNEGAARITDAYPPATLRRLRAIKTQYDPQNLFRLNQNILPA